MAVTVPTVGALFVQVDLQAALTTICGYIDAANAVGTTNTANIATNTAGIATAGTAATANAAADAAMKAAFLAWINAVQAAVETSIGAHGDNTNLGLLRASFTTLKAALA